MSALLARRHITGVATDDPVSTRCTSSSASDCATRLPYMCALMTCWTSKYGTDDAITADGQRRAMKGRVLNRLRATPGAGRLAKKRDDFLHHNEYASLKVR